MVRTEPVFKKCFDCLRNFPERKFRELELHSIPDFGPGRLLEVRRCTCKILIGVEYPVVPLTRAQMRIGSTALLRDQRKEILEENPLGIHYRKPNFGR